MSQATRFPRPAHVALQGERNHVTHYPPLHAPQPVATAAHAHAWHEDALRRRGVVTQLLRPSCVRRPAGA